MKQFLLVIFFLPLFTACDDGPGDMPSADEITTAMIEKFHDDPYANVAHIENVKKTNSLKNSDSKVTIMVHYDLVFDRSMADFANDIAQKGKNADSADAVGDTVKDAIDLVKTKMMTLKEGDFKIGDRRSAETEIEMVKSEKGWIYRP